MKRSRRDPHSLAGAYALDALGDEAEQERFARHLRRCPACEQQVRGFREVAASLAFAAAAEPPPELRPRVMAAVARTRQLPPEVASSPRSWRVPVPRFPRLPRGTWLPRLALVTAAAAIAAVIALSISLSGTTQQLHTAQAQSQAIAALLAAPDARTATGKVATGGAAAVLLSVDRHELVVSTTGLAALPSGKTYQIWLIGPSATQKKVIRSAGLLPPAASGRTTPVLASGLTAGDVLGLTVEPAGGSTQPTTNPILELKLRGRA